MKRLLVRQIENLSTTIGDTNELDKIVTIPLFWQRICGQQVLDPKWTWRKYLIHQILILALFVYVFFGTLDCLKITTDAEIIAEASYTLIMIVHFPIKTFLFLNNRLIFRKLFLNIKTKFIETLKSDTTVNINEVFKAGSRIVYILLLLVIVPISIYEFTTVWFYIHGKKLTLSRSTTTLMPMVTPYYEVALFLHSFFLLVISSTIILDMWYVLLIYFLCASSDTLVNVINEEGRKNSESEEFYATRLNNSLREFYRLHINQVEYMEGLRRMYKWLAFVPLCNAALCTCLILLLMSKEINWKFAPHMMPMFAEIFAYNWFGEQIKTKATDLYHALINFDWQHVDVKYRKNYYIILTYMQKTFGIKTAIGNDLSLITMTNVIKISYQAFTVLQSMDS